MNKIPIIENVFINKIIRLICDCKNHLGTSLRTSGNTVPNY